MSEYAGIVRTGQPREALVTVESNVGGDLLLTAVRDLLAHLPVRVEPRVRTSPTEGAP